MVAGFSVGFAIGGLLAAWMVRVVGDPRHLLAFDVGASALFIGLVMEIGRRYPQQLRTEPHPIPVTSDGVASGGLLLRSRVVRLVFAYQVLSAAVTQLLDFMVWERAAARYPDVGDLAAFLGVFGAIINVIIRPSGRPVHRDRTPYGPGCPAGRPLLRGHPGAAVCRRRNDVDSPGGRR